MMSHCVSYRVNSAAGLCCQNMLVELWLFSKTPINSICGLVRRILGDFFHKIILVHSWCTFCQTFDSQVFTVGQESIKFILPEFVSYLGERGMLCVGKVLRKKIFKIRA